MKQAVSFALPRLFDLFKIDSNRVYAALATFLVACQTQLSDPDTMADLAATFPDQPFLVRVITMLPTLLLALFGTSTSKKMEEFRTLKKETF